MIAYDTRARVLSAVIECHIFQSLSHDIVLSFDWLCIYSLYTDLWAGNLLIQVSSGHYLLVGLPCDSIVHVELTSLELFCKEFDYGSVAWFTLVHPVEPADAIGACGALASGKLGDA